MLNEPWLQNSRARNCNGRFFLRINKHFLNNCGPGFSFGHLFWKKEGKGKESSTFQFEVVCDNLAHLNQYWKVSALYQFVLDIFRCQVATSAVQ